MTVREGCCPCGQLVVRCTGDPVRVSVCHCLDCQRRSGSAFAAQARWPAGDVALVGTSAQWTKRSESGSLATFSFCPQCGSNMLYRSDAMPDLVAVPIGGFADPKFPAPIYSVYEDRKQSWVEITSPGTDHHA